VFESRLKRSKGRPRRIRLLHRARKRPGLLQFLRHAMRLPDDDLERLLATMKTMRKQTKGDENKPPGRTD